MCERYQDTTLAGMKETKVQIEGGEQFEVGKLLSQLQIENTDPIVSPGVTAALSSVARGGMPPI